MAISEIHPLKPVRRNIVFGGEQPIGKDELSFTARGYEKLVPIEDIDISSATELAFIDAVVFTVRTRSGSDLIEFLDKYANFLLDHDCPIYIRVNRNADPQQAGRNVVINAVDDRALPLGWLTDTEKDGLTNRAERNAGLSYAPLVYICDLSFGWDAIAQLIVRNPAGPAPSQALQITVLDSSGAPIQLAPSQCTLIRRAFFDCAKVHLMQMPDGLSGAKVFRAFSETSLTPGAWPLIHFVKVDVRRSIVSEYDQYDQQGLDFIPFHLSPHLDSGRCALGAHDGVLVGDLIQEAMSLRECATTGFAVTALSNLFNKTLRPWHHASMMNEDRSIPEYFDGAYQQKIKFPTTIPAKRLRKVRSLGTMKPLTELNNIFAAQAKTPTRVGTIHGDLNATNVLVRNADAIIIDFNDIQSNMPLVYDAACLEGGLLVDGFIKDNRPLKEWLASITPLYQKAALVDWIESCHPSDASRWFYDCVRQIRIHARQFECQPGQYATVLALALLKKACNEHDFEGSKDALDKKRAGFRAGAYILGQKILEELSVDVGTLN